MGKGIKKGVSKLVVVMMIVALFPIVKWNTVEVKGTPVELTVATAGDLYSNIKENTGTAIVLNIVDHLQIDESITLTEKDDVTIDLKGHNITGDLSGYMISSNGQLAIIDSIGGGNIVNSDSKGGIITTSGGSLNISEGIFNNPHNCVLAENTTINISGGSFYTANAEDGVSMYLKAGNTVTISGDNTVFSSPYVAISSLNGSALTINNGIFIANPPDDSFGSAVYVDNEKGSLTINGGRFTRNGKAGKALFIGASILDSSVHLRGGTYDGGIGKSLGGEDPDANYSEYYGMTGYPDLPGIIDSGYVLTDNTFVLESGDTILDTSLNVSIISGILLQPNTNRSQLEEYTDQLDGTLKDQYVVDPISIGADGTVYQNSGEEVIPTVDQEKLISKGITYTFNNWMDDRGNIYTSINEFISKSSSDYTTKYLDANWKAQVSTEGQLTTAISDYPVDVIELTTDVTLEKGIILEGSGSKTLDLGGNTISYSRNGDASEDAAGDAALGFYGNVTIKNGKVVSTGGPALLLGNGVTIEDLHCTSDTVTVFVNMETNKIISGVFETTGTTVLQFWGDSTTKESDYNNLFDGSSYPSSSVKQATCDENNICSLNTSKLLVSTTPITYIENVDPVLGEVTYGDSIELNATISNEDYTGDIVIDDVTVDNATFEVKGNTSVTLVGGSSDTYSYTIMTVPDTELGTYNGTVSISYTKMDDTKGVIQQQVSLVVVEETVDAGGVKYLVAGRSYRLGSGSWTVNDDTTVYGGDISFYVSVNGDYSFTKK